METNNLANLRCFHKYGWAAIGAIFDMHLYSDRNKLYASYGIRNSWLFFFACIPFVAMLIELINFIISLLRISHKPDLSKEVEQLGSRIQINLKDIEYLYVLERSKFTVIFDRISLFIPLISLFALYLYRSRVILKLHSGQKYKFDFFYSEDAEEFKNILLEITRASFINQEQSLKKEALDIFLTSAIFFTVQLGMFAAIIIRTLEFFFNPFNFVDEELELFVILSFGFWIPLVVKFFDSRLNWQTNYRYLISRSNG